jgi:phosphotransferase system IIB component
LFYEYIGNKENIVSIKLNGSRLTIVLNDYNLVNKEQLKTLGVVSIVALKDKMTLVLSEEGKKYFISVAD